MQGFFDTKIEFLKGVGPQKAALLNKELNIFTYGDLIQHYPFRYEDRTQFHEISTLNGAMSQVQIKGKIRSMQTIGEGRKKRLVVQFADGTGEIELVWFKGIQWVMKKIQPGMEYLVFGKPTAFGSKLNMAHPEIELITRQNQEASYLQPVYTTTEVLKRKFLDSKAIGKLQLYLLQQAQNKIRETLPKNILEDYRLINKRAALNNIHYPKDQAHLQKAQFRLKFEELFYVQLRLLKLKIARIDKFKGAVFHDTDLLTRFYNDHLPFDLTDAQKRVIKEIYKDMRSGQQMNRLLQGDVGSGKTIVAFICMLLVVGSGSQAALMAPTEILATQHFQGLKEFADQMGITIALLTGSTKQSERKIIHQYLKNGDLNIIVGTHALLEDIVQFKNLGLAVVDEQHRFGVAQRSKLWQKNQYLYPHVLVMTATPIPRTLAMTLYGDLDISVIDQLPAGRKPIKTVHRYDANRLKVNGFLKEQLEVGRQVYIVYPLIEESEKLDLNHLMDGYESMCRAFPDVPISIVHGKMKPDAKDYEMQRFVKAETKIMVATTVIEVGVNVPNASVMVIENAERFGLAQLHQLRGRVGRGAEQSYCILMTNYKLSKEGKVRIDTMVRTTNGFEIADTDLQLRGPGDLMGTQQSGVLDLLIADLGKDGVILQAARGAALSIIDKDPDLSNVENQVINQQINSMKKTAINWSRIS
ncbi:ATP-dependent DNA helicase RecG [Fulvivirga sediminis]|uniref:ATP-dependent DNA helicase RecG n=1 Tax=Fulvivirga sediminis TaxID=2803949 RepID=A0A937F8S2_9BACT|nr:ATP-dependent DNA helicase RecG [Fulvivirga sediminis]MBL3657800.1 ATP-dependent DNA helicase RecG [Fulvivirga sediminis]